MRIFIIALSLVISASAWADEPAIGYVKNVMGVATISTGSQTTAAETGTAVYLGAFCAQVRRAAWA